MMVNKKWMIGGILVLVLLGTTSITFTIGHPTIAQTNHTNGDYRENHKGYLMSQLTEEQREIFSQRMQEIKELREAGASQEEMREAKLQLMEELGIDIDETPCGMMNGIGKEFMKGYQAGR